jgi:hypothetical protein
MTTWPGKIAQFQARPCGLLRRINATGDNDFGRVDEEGFVHEWGTKGSLRDELFGYSAPKVPNVVGSGPVEVARITDRRARRLRPTVKVEGYCPEKRMTRFLGREGVSSNFAGAKEGTRPVDRRARRSCPTGVVS